MYNLYTYKVSLFQKFSNVELEGGLFAFGLFCNNFIYCHSMTDFPGVSIQFLLNLNIYKKPFGNLVKMQIVIQRALGEAC